MTVLGSLADTYYSFKACTLMDLQPQLIIELAALGICTGFLAGLLGIGGGMVIVAFITFMLSHRGVDADLAVKMALATWLASNAAHRAPDRERPRAIHVRRSWRGSGPENVPAAAG